MKTSEEIIISIHEQIKNDRGYVNYDSLEDTIMNVLKQNQNGKGYKESTRAPEYNTLQICVRKGLMKKVTDKRFSFSKRGYWVNEPYLKEFLYSWVIV